MIQVALLQEIVLLMRELNQAGTSIGTQNVAMVLIGIVVHHLEDVAKERKRADFIGPQYNSSYYIRGGVSMKLETNKNEHRKFLKTERTITYDLGEFFPEKLYYSENSDAISFNWDYKVQYSTVIFIMSQYCSACDYTAVKKFTQKYKKFTYLIFIEGSNDFVNNIISKYEFPFDFLRCDLDIINKELNIKIIPFVIGINRVGQIVAGGLINSIESIEREMKPLLDVFYNERY